MIIDGVEWKFKDVPTGNPPYASGTLSIYRMVNGSPIYLKTDAGTIDYQRGVVSVNNVKIDDIKEDPIFKELTITVSLGTLADPNHPTQIFIDHNVYTNGRNQVIILKTNGVSVTLLPDGNQ